MVELSSKVELFHRMIWGEAKKASNQALYEATESTTLLIEKRKQEVEEKNRQAAERRVRLAEERSNREIALQKEANRQKRLAMRETCLEEVLAALQARLRAYTQTSEYREALQSELQTALATHVAAQVRVLPQDQAFVQAQIGAQIPVSALPAEELGGFILDLQGGRTRLRCTLRAQLEENAYEIGKELTEWLEKRQ
uniref:V-type ATP synthase subunit E n=1 Tax=Ndongobacter massiliensis TaxID=1871025 RepID=UPI000931FE78|nr:V-type ATP synthase subunit E family protein [Ndongobacter massiliensis]